MQQSDAYTWQIRYKGDTWLLEFDNERPDGRGWAEVEHALVQSIDLLPTGEGKVHSVHIPDGATPVFFRRRQVTLDPNTEVQQHGTLAHCIGWKQDENAVYLFVFEDGSTLLTDDLQAV